MTRPRPKRDTNTAYNSIGRAAKDSTDVWATPKHVLKWARERFGDFSLDAAASEWNSAAPEWIDEEADGLKTPWITDGVVWCNPPYGKLARKFVQRAWEQVQKGNCKKVVMLLACRTDTLMFQEDIFPNASNVHFIGGRLKFGDETNTANFASVIVVFDADHDVKKGAQFSFGRTGRSTKKRGKAKSNDQASFGGIFE